MSKIKWILDAAHSELTFKVKHLMISTVTGQFKTFSVVVETTDNDFANLSPALVSVMSKRHVACLHATFL